MRILIIGCGSIGNKHAVNFKKYCEVGIYDVNMSLSKQISDQINAFWFESIDTALEWEPDGVVIATPTSTHVKLATDVIMAGFDVLVEKPISHNIEDADDLIKKAKELNRKIFVVSNMRFHQGVTSLKENLHRVGKPLFSRAHFGNYIPNMRPGRDYRNLYCSNRSMGGGVVLDSIHEIDYLINLFGPVESVNSTVNKLSDLEIDVEDYAELVLIHSNNVRSSVHMDYLRPFKRRGCEIVGDEGMLLWQSEGKNPEKCSVKYYHIDGSDAQVLFNDNNLGINAEYNQLAKNFIKTLEGEGNLLLTGSEALDQIIMLINLKNN